MKYSIGNTLYCVDPYVFTISAIIVIDYDDNFVPFYYIDESGAYYEEDTLYKDLIDAKNQALFLLEEFYINRRLDINSYKGEN